ncbi:MAG TPA: dipeptidase [Candidatus Acidoferrales bacterium]|nr:dipeptidase [Candidatus Acidoferrales bacterium]
MTRMWIIWLCCACAIVLPLAVVTASDQATDRPAISKRAHDLHFSSIVIDTHDDTTQRLLDPAFDIGVRHSDGNVDIPRMREGGLGALFFSVYIPGTITGPQAIKQALDQIDAVRETVAKYPKDLMFARTADDIRRAHAEGKIACLMGVEGGHMIADDLGVLRIYGALGVRYMTLTHMVNTDWADSSTDKPAHNGLTDFGKQVVREMNRLGIMVDISHVSDKTFYDALAVSQAPLIASHSSCRALCSAPRNMTDDMIRALAAKGGVIQINYHAGFLSNQYRAADTPEIDKEIDAEVAKRCAGKIGCDEVEDNTVTREFMEQGKLPRVDWTAIVDNIDHAVKVGGVDHVGLGSDFDGSVMPFGMEDASHLPQITDALLKRGYSDADVRKILGGNTLRVMEAAEAAAKRLQGEKP